MCICTFFVERIPPSHLLFKIFVIFIFLPHTPSPITAQSHICTVTSSLHISLHKSTYHISEERCIDSNRARAIRWICVGCNSLCGGYEHERVPALQDIQIMSSGCRRFPPVLFRRLLRLDRKCYQHSWSLGMCELNVNGAALQSHYHLGFASLLCANCSDKLCEL